MIQIDQQKHKIVQQKSKILGRGTVYLGGIPYTGKPNTAKRSVLFTCVRLVVCIYWMQYNRLQYK